MNAAATPYIRALHENVLQQADAHLALAADDALLAKKAERVSRWSIAQQLEHLSIVNAGIIKRIKDGVNMSGDAKPSGRVSLVGCIVLWIGKIPRGANAPETTLPQNISANEIRARLKAIRDAVADLEPRLAEIEAAPGRTAHPVLGMFKGVHWLRFIPIHNNHHQKIIHEIRNA
jgi:hypothetical protein